ncbi:GDP-L-fucose synthase [Ignavibacteria bacterium 4148-Me]|uniref:GDP-L-fucose synthase family protein n=1 Tax=Rosettibacter primus TaxID=3111523 RepID=UPI00336BECCA
MKKLYLAGHTGMVGSAILRKLQQEGYTNLVLRTSKELDLRNQKAVNDFFATEKPEIVIVAAAKVGGILANNTYRAEFIYDNLMIEANVIHASYINNVEKLIFLGSSCIYPKFAPQPMKEEYLLSGYLEYTNEPYAMAKIAGIKLCENYYKQYGCNFYSVMPTNLYGPNDNFDLETSHVLPALIRKFHEAKAGKIEELRSKNEELRNKKEELRIKNSEVQEYNEELRTKNEVYNTVTVWGSGKPRREFLYVDDLADAIYFLMNKIEAKDIYDQGITHLNIGTGEDLTIAELAELIKNIIGFDGEIVYDTTKPDGTPRKLLDVTRIHNLGWKHKTSLEEGIRKTYEWFVGGAGDRELRV